MNSATDIVAGDFRDNHMVVETSEMAECAATARTSYVAAKTSKGDRQIGRRPSIQTMHVAWRNITSSQEPSCAARRLTKRQLMLQKKDDDVTLVAGDLCTREDLQDGSVCRGATAKRRNVNK